MDPEFDCVVCGTCTVDLLVRTVPLAQPLGPIGVIRTEGTEVALGGIVGNSGVALARLGMRTAALSYVGDDAWAAIVRERLGAESVDTRWLFTHPAEPTGTTVALIDDEREHAFLHCGGAAGAMDAGLVLAQLDLIRRSRWLLLAYYGELPRLVDDLPELLARVRATGCRTALDATTGGAAMEPLAGMLPNLDAYVPSYAEAAAQTGEAEPRRMIDAFRACGAPGLLGVKLGAEGALLSPAAGSYVPIPPVAPPRPIRQTIGAGDSFYAGLLTGLCRGLPVEAAGRLAAAAGACRVSSGGENGGVRGFVETAALAGI